MQRIVVIVTFVLSEFIGLLLSNIEVNIRATGNSRPGIPGGPVCSSLMNLCKSFILPHGDTDGRFSEYKKMSF